MNSVVFSSLLIAAPFLLTGLLLFWFARPRRGDVANADRSFVRSWIAMSLVLGLLIFTAAVIFTTPTSDADQQIRTTLVTALTTSVAAAISFYFATKANAAVIAALTPSSLDPVPDLVGLTADEALRLLGLTGFKLASADLTVSLALTSTKITAQDPKPEMSAARGSTIAVTFEGPAATVKP